MTDYDVTRHSVERSTLHLNITCEGRIVSPSGLWLSPEREQRAGEVRGKQKQKHRRK